MLEVLKRNVAAAQRLDYSGWLHDLSPRIKDRQYFIIYSPVLRHGRRCERPRACHRLRAAAHSTKFLRNFSDSNSARRGPRKR